jgi:DHA1 family bicyclomycin/chloramphenicol resistance-like MFS transporter
MNSMNHSTVSPIIKSQSHRVRIALILGFLAAIGPLSIDMYLPSLPSITKELGTTTSLAQLSLTACLLGIALGQIFVGPISDVKGRRKPLLIAIIIYGLASVLCALSNSIWMFIIMRFVQGASGSAGIVISRAIVRDLYSGPAMTKFFSLLMLVTGVAPILAPISGGQILNFTTWRGVFIVLFAISLLMLVAIVFVLPETLPKKERSVGGIKGTLGTYGKLLKDRTFMGYALTQGLVFASLFAYISASPFVIQDIYGASPQLYSLFFGINGLGIIISTQVVGRLVGRIDASKILLFGLCLSASSGLALLISILLGAGLPWILVSLFFIVSSMGIVATTCFSLAMQDHKKSAGSSSALLGLTQFILGGSVAPIVGIAGSSSAVPMGVVVSACSLGAMLCYLFLVKFNKTKDSPVENRG